MIFGGAGISDEGKHIYIIHFIHIFLNDREYPTSQCEAIAFQQIKQIPDPCNCMTFHNKKSTILYLQPKSGHVTWRSNSPKHLPK